MEVTVVVATYGDNSWFELAEQRALPSVPTGIPTIHAHAPDRDLAYARNAGLAGVDTEWVCFLDADDELEAGYLHHMSLGTADLRAPAVRYVTNGRHGAARMPRVAGHVHACGSGCLRDGNWLVIGTLVRTELVRAVGGWRDFEWSEDWDLWLRCWQAGATIEPIRRAIYRAHVRRDSRNRAPSRDEKLATHRAIAAANGIPA